MHGRSPEYAYKVYAIINKLQQQQQQQQQVLQIAVQTAITMHCTTKHVLLMVKVKGKTPIVNSTLS